jgi:hypothetical protein
LDDPDGTLTKYEEQMDALHAGRTPRPEPGAPTVKVLANNFLNHKKAKLDNGELTPRTWTDYRKTCTILV